MITLADVQSARERIKPYVYKTPTYSSPFFSGKIGAEVFLKLECYQPTGVFKIRGAFNLELQNLEHVKKSGVVTASSGNHGLSVAFASRALGVKSVVVVTKAANPDKVKMIRLYGAEVIEGGPTSDSVIQLARSISKERGMYFVSPFDDNSIIAGQGTIGLEIMEDVPTVQTIIVPVGGGGLISGVATVAKALSPHCKIVGVEPTGVPSLYESMKQGERITVIEPRTIADGLIGQTVGTLNFEICREKVDEVVLVSDEQMVSATKSLLIDCHVLAEPSGAAPLAALLSGAYKPRPGEKIALVISGGNIAYTLLQDMLNDIYPERVHH